MLKYIGGKARRIYTSGPRKKHKKPKRLIDATLYAPIPSIWRRMYLALFERAKKEAE